MSLFKEPQCRFDEYLWNYIKAFVHYRKCDFSCFKVCENPGTKIFYKILMMGKVKFFYVCLDCYSNLFHRKLKEKEVYSAIRKEVSTKVVSVADLRAKIKVLSDTNLLRVLSIPTTFRNMRPLNKMRSHVLLYKIPEEEEAKKKSESTDVALSVCTLV